VNTIKQEQNPVMRAAEVWKMLHIGKNTLYEWCRQGRIPYKRVGCIMLFSRKAILEWLVNNENKEGR